MIPHFAIPFRINGVRGAVVTEQDSEQEILDCVEVIIRYQHGDRPEKPDFGIPDLTFSEPSPNTNLIKQYVDLWEPRIDMDIGEAVLNQIDPLIQYIHVERTKPPNG
jgi:hypothetical protein